ncbi:glycoside hydrolase family 88 protein [Chitinophaga rhizophila]|uniref:Alpha-L-rhamnosidase six-hairpin glycosidase domain-containing protein n=1 Tax=Chitinophaga rhizophila TaxID=2866212 RepID=A0ABS7G5U8_9BACT|nr:hypothetical protein [Chitinophaga rhizophila]MBW8682851.1 hypothetical protein [Chitinophaga rhizophila]
MTHSLSPWAVAASRYFMTDEKLELYKIVFAPYTFQVYATPDSIWITVSQPSGGKVMFRAAYCAGGHMTIKYCTKSDTGLHIGADCPAGDQRVLITIDEGKWPVLHYQTTFTPAAPVFIPFWPRDIVVSGEDNKPENTEGELHVKQAGTRSGLLYFTERKPAFGAVLYLQNLTALAAYNEVTGTSAKELVGGQWPEIGMALPTTNDKSLPADESFIVNDAYVTFDTNIAITDTDMSRQFVDMLAAVYLKMPRPETTYKHWPDILEKGLQDLDNHGCWTYIAGKKYLNAYFCDYKTPPEIMVQLAVLLPQLDFAKWSGRDLPVIADIRKTVNDFYNPELKTIMRWLPAVQDWLEGEEEQKAPLTMDSWYLHHPLLNLARLAAEGDKDAERLFFDSLDYTTKVARHFNYKWPVFYKMDTLEVLKEETAPGKGGEKDVAGLYAHILLQAYELSGNATYLEEAERAAETLAGLGFELFYQANNTAFSAKALLKLWKVTGKRQYLDLSITCLANIFRNVQLWDCNYGFGKHYGTFFGLFPLNDAPYTAAYEESEVFCALNEYLALAEGEPVPDSIRLLASEYIRYLIDRACYYYPPMLPEEMLSKEIKTGELDRNLWIVLEDLNDGWLPSGAVGQEVYGSGNAFGIVPRHYHYVPEAGFGVAVDYPVVRFDNSQQQVSFDILGSNQLRCRLVLLKISDKELPQLTVRLQGEKIATTGNLLAEGHLAYEISGGQHVDITW